MGASVSRLTQSQYFSPVFNTAVFDGPVRIYFSQKQEAYALEIYFKISSRLRSVYGEGLNRKGPSVFLMVHPQQEGFNESFSENPSEPFAISRLESDFVIGVNGTLDTESMTQLIDKVVEVYSSSRILNVEEPRL